MLLILSTTLFLISATFFDSLWIPVFMAGVEVVILTGIFLIRKGYKNSIKISMIFLPFYSLIISIAGMTFLHHSYQSKQEGIGTMYVGTGQITENHGNGRYIFTDPEQREYLYYSDNKYMVGTILDTHVQIEINKVESNIWQTPVLTELYTKAVTLTDTEWGFDKVKWMLMKGWSATMYEKRALIAPQQSASFILKARQKLIAMAGEAYSGKTLGLTLGMLIGDRSQLTKEQYAGFVDSGLVHIIAVSGGNIVLLVAFISAVLFFLPYYIRLLIVAAAVFVYALICGGDSSVIRATAMALMSIGALFAGRQLTVRRSMGYVYICMLLVNPYYLLYDLGFIFSFAALSGLVYFSQRRAVLTSKKITVKSLFSRYRNIYLLPSIAASIGIFTPLLFFTGKTNLLSILSNLAVIPLVPFVMIYGFLSSFLYSVFSWEVILYPQSRAVEWIYAVNDRSIQHSLILYSHDGRTRIAILLLTVIIIAIIMISYNVREKRMV